MPPVTRKRVQKAKGYQRPDHEGKLYRVRDKDYSDGQPVKIWGENLTYESAHALKERVVGRKQSRTARIEEMSAALPSADPTLESVRQKGLSAGRGAAAAAQQRANLAARKARNANAASAPKPRFVAPKPVPMKLDAEIEAPEVEEEDEIDESDDVAIETAAADDDINEYEQKGKELYEAYMMASGSSGTSWDGLAPKDQAAFSFEATAEQGPHIDAVKAFVGNMSDSEQAAVIASETDETNAPS